MTSGLSLKAKLRRHPAELPSASTPLALFVASLIGSSTLNTVDNVFSIEYN
jgi:hypothetical protein